ncbi:MAG: flagellar type III secretion system pore protein FliP [Desulfotalea sp.]
MKISLKHQSAALIGLLVLLCGSCTALAINVPTVSFGIQNADSPEQVSTALQVMFLMTVLSVAPAIVLMMTSFTRIVIVLGFIRQAMGTQNMPPTQIILGLSLFLTFFIMAPTINEINDNALQPYLKKEINQDVAFDHAVDGMRKFMFSQVQEAELKFMADLTLEIDPNDGDDIPTTTLIPAFMLSELKRAFSMGFMVYIPFLVIDMIVASVLMSMGMMMLPPVIISMPFKLLLFILVDGWSLIVGSLIKSFS